MTTNDTMNEFNSINQPSNVVREGEMTGASEKPVWIRVLFFPLVMLTSLAIFWASLQYDVPIGLAALGATIVNIIAVAITELVIPLRPGHSAIHDWQTFNNIVHGLTASEVGGRAARALIDVGLVSLYGSLTAGEVPFVEGLNIQFWPKSAPFWFQFALGFLVIEFLFYWQHRMFHSARFFWRFHALHHNADKMHVMSSARLHFFEIFVRHALIFGPIVLLGAPQEIIFFYLAFNNSLGNVVHSNVDVLVPRWLHGLMVTPGVHHLHHSRKREQSDSNFGASITFFDRIFGTFKHPEEESIAAFGIEDDPFGRSIPSQLLVPLNPWKRYP
ncbi:hypothetical protein CH373_01385 [Leptospira perolatii]|uniref:Fatty acid hydroxylase domain-containing protein n=1 Tax=Leptospira perolatii TaxID=2023191 RepID=A0A2M9ZRL1_9LEPT|nr:sterol desaturase family protein [Leptospira perolatii]PJZ71194.1 hypothetical protein CH360_01385 [Leptospira perolatii]PJZ74727.1 hypothetical protein CH373_01385 [Leptospira perolatii]